MECLCVSLLAGLLKVLLAVLAENIVPMTGATGTTWINEVSITGL